MEKVKANNKNKEIKKTSSVGLEPHKAAGVVIIFIVVIILIITLFSFSVLFNVIDYGSVNT